MLSLTRLSYGHTAKMAARRWLSEAGCEENGARRTVRGERCEENGARRTVRGEHACRRTCVRADRQVCVQTDRCACRRTDRLADMRADGQTGLQTCVQTDRHVALAQTDRHAQEVTAGHCIHARLLLPLTTLNAAADRRGEGRGTEGARGGRGGGGFLREGCIWMHLDAFGCIWMHLTQPGRDAGHVC
jgi:hypothetical protein